MRAAPPVLAVGDTHVENFGTWRDAEGRLVWGVNDFDEAAVSPYAFDLVRLAASARLPPDRVLGNRKAAAAIVDGYRAGLKKPRPSLLDERETWMRKHVACTDEDRDEFWCEVDRYPRADPPSEVAAMLRASLPEGVRDVAFATRAKGTGSLGRPRFVAVATWRGGRVVREAKALVPSAWNWAHGETEPASGAMELATGPHRAPDPHLRVERRYVLRRVAADLRKIELGRRAGEELHAKGLRAMAFDLGSIHAADRPAVRRIRAHLDAAPPDGFATPPRPPPPTSRWTSGRGARPASRVTLSRVLPPRAPLRCKVCAWNCMPAFAVIDASPH